MRAGVLARRPWLCRGSGRTGRQHEGEAHLPDVVRRLLDDQPADRVRLLHMKDRAGGAEPHDVPPGEGTLPFRAIVEAGRSAGVEWYIVEQDEPKDPLEDVARGLRYLESLAD